MGVPTLRQVVLDTTDPRGLAEFYRVLLGLACRPGDEPPTDGRDDEPGRDPQEPLRVYADRSGHTFCIFVVHT